MVGTVVAAYVRGKFKMYTTIPQQPAPALFDWKHKHSSRHVGHDSHPAIGVLVVESFSKSDEAPRSFHREIHTGVTQV